MRVATRPAAGLRTGMVVFACIAGLSGCGEKPAPPPPPKSQVDVVVVKPQAVTLTTELPGRVTPYRVAEVRPQVGGVLLKRLFTEGDTVKAGQQLYQIDPAPYEASLASAQATLARAEASVVSAQATVDRYKPLLQIKAVSQQDYDTAFATLRQDQADVASGKASVKTAQINLGYTKMVAPISGRTSRSSVTEGALVTAEQTTSLVTITQLDPIYVDVTQPSTTVLRLKREYAANQLTRAGDNQAEVKLLLEDGTSYGDAGKLQFAEVTVDQNTGSVTLRAIFPNTQELLLPGMFVHETIDEGVRPDGILVPQQGVARDQAGDASAMVVGDGDKAEKRPVTTDRAIGSYWLVSSGLKPGDRVIIDNLQKVKPGADVVAHEVPADQAVHAAPSEGAVKAGAPGAGEKPQ